MPSIVALIEAMTIIQHLKPNLVKMKAQNALSRGEMYLELEFATLKASSTLACLKVFVSYFMRRFLKLEFKK